MWYWRRIYIFPFIIKNLFNSVRKDYRLFKIINNVLVDLPCPIKISFFWKFGSLLGVTFVFQFLSGIFLSMHYVSDIKVAFSSLDLIKREIKKGWILRYLHIRGASFFFLFMYIHIARKIYFFSFNLTYTWLVGVFIFIISMAIAFLGYVLPWGQMSYWGATVITKFFSVIPFIGKNLVIWIWGGFAVDSPTLTRFFSLHFIFPFVLIAFIVLHFFFLHETGSNNPLGLKSNKDKIYFFPSFLKKDILGFFILFVLSFFFFFYTESIMEYQKFLEANSLVTPTHIQPEWYFLPAYAILRAIPNKLGGVIGLVFFILVLFFFPLFLRKKKKPFFFRNLRFKIVFQVIFWLWIIKFFLLVWVGACPVEYPYLQLSRVFSFLYFSFFIIFFFFKKSIKMY